MATETPPANNVLDFTAFRTNKREEIKREIRAIIEDMVGLVEEMRVTRNPHHVPIYMEAMKRQSEIVRMRVESKDFNLVEHEARAEFSKMFQDVTVQYVETRKRFIKTV